MNFVSNTTVEQELRQLGVFVTTLFPNPQSLTFQILPEVQQQELNKLRVGRRAEQFFFIVDFIQLTILEAVGLEEIGYDSARFNFRQYLSTISTDGLLQLVTLLGKQTFLLSNKVVLDFLKPQFVAFIPITCADGRVMLTKRTISPWQITNTGQITSYLSEFLVLKPYENEPMNPRFVDIDPAIEAQFNRLVSRLFANLPVQVNQFAPKELVLLKLYVETNETNATAKILAQKAGIKPSTVHTYNKNILLKAKAMFGESLPVKTAYDVAVFLKKSGLLG